MDPSECVTDLLAGVNEKRDETSRSLTLHYERSSEWLTEAIQTCKRKILEGTGHEATEPKRMKKETTDKENVPITNVNKQKMEKPKKRAVPASSRKAKKADMHPPEYLRVMSLKVAELRTELRQRNLDTTGLKKVLQNRLLKDIALKQSQQQQEYTKSASKSTVKDRDGDVQMKDSGTRATSDDTETMDVDEIAATKPNDRPAVTASAMKAEAKNETKVLQETAVAKSSFKSSAGLFSPSKITLKIHSAKKVKEVKEKSSTEKLAAQQLGRSSLAESLKKTASAILSASPAKKGAGVKAEGSASKGRPVLTRREATIEDSPPDRQSIEPKQPDSSSTTKFQTVNMDSVPSLPNKLGSVDKNVGAATKAKRNKCAADRMARLAEIRGKSKPITSTKSSVATDLPALSASKGLKLTKAKDPKNDRKVLLAAQMREKAAGLKVQQSSKVLSSSKGSAPKQQPREFDTTSSTAVASAAETPASTKKTTATAPASTDKTSSASASAIKVATMAKVATSVSTTSDSVQPQFVPKITASPSLVAQMAQLASTSTIKSSKTTSSTKKRAARPDILSPMSTYELSDREQSDSEDEDEDQHHRPNNKKIPRWAHKNNLLPALEAQYANVNNRLDPETIFPPVATCNLDDIFDKKKSRFNRRTSSANWARDGVTSHEIVAYKRAMGY